jgi:GT2 family glycosyltransferase
LITSPTRVSVIIVNWNGTGDTLECLRSVASAKSNNVDVDVIVVDNASEVDPTAEIKSAFAGATVARLERNVGFAAGCNVGIKEAIAKGSDYILLLNNDTIIKPGLFDALLASFQKDSKLGIISPVVYDSTGEQFDFAGAKINFALGEFAHIQTKPQSDLIRTDYVSGSCMMIPRSAIERIGLFDEPLFAYFEDVDLCLRARRAGLGLGCTPTATIVHKGSASTRRTLSQGTTSALKHYLIARNRTIIVNRYASFPSKWSYLIVSNPLRACFYTAGFIVRGRWNKLRWYWRGLLDGLLARVDMPADLTSAT